MKPRALRAAVLLPLLLLVPARAQDMNSTPAADATSNAAPAAMTPPPAETPTPSPQPAGITPAPVAAPAPPTTTAASSAPGDIKAVYAPGDLTPTTKPFVHPGLYYTATDLDFMRKKLEAHAEPWASAWEKNKPTEKDDSWQPHAEPDWDANDKSAGFYMGGDPVVAHKEALQWALTGNQANADVAIKILNAWATTMKSIVQHPAMPQEKLATGVCIAQLCNAAELLIYGGPNGKKSGWSDSDIAQFKKMLEIPAATMKGFYPGYNGNWDMIIMDSTICAGIFLDDHDMFDSALHEYMAGTQNGGINNYVYPSGQCQESARDQGHVQWGLGNAVAVCEVAWKQGVDIYGAYDNRLLAGLEYTAKYNLGNDVPFEQKGKGPISPKSRGKFAPIYEAPLQHYTIRRGLEMPFVKQVVSANRPEGTFTVGINWGTFTMYKGDEDPQAAKK